MSTIPWRARVLRLALAAGMRLVPPAHRAVVYGSPDFEENALAVLAGLARDYDGEVVLLADDPAAARRYLAVFSSIIPMARPVRILRKWDRLPALWTFVSSELVLYTHTLMGAPAPVGRRVHINLWHGTGPKQSANRDFSDRVGADGMSGAVLPWLLHSMRALHMRPEAVPLPGNARQDVLHSRRDLSARLRRIGLDPDRPFVLWVPTYRAHTLIGAGAVADGRRLSDDRDVMTAFREAAQRHGVQLVLKPHPDDVDALEDLGVPYVGSAEVWAAGMSVYELLGRAAGVISDYSSMWVDFLETGRSVGLFCPDLARYAQDRGLQDPPLHDVAAGLFLDDSTAAEEFFAAIARGDVWREDDLGRCRERLEHVPDAHRTERLLAAVGRLAEARGLRGRIAAPRIPPPG